MAKTSITAKLGLDTTAFQRGLAKSQKSIGKFVKSGIAKFGALAGAAGLGSMAKAAIDLGSKISDMAVQLNIGTTELQVLDFAAREAGVGTDIMARAVRNVQLRTEEAIKGNKSYGQAFEQLGINIEEFKKLKTEEKLEAIAVAQANATDKAAAYNSVSRILGEKAGPALQEVLQNLAGPQGYGGLEAAAERAGEVMSKETIAKMDNAADQIESFKRRMTVLTAEVLTKVVPAFGILSNGLGFVGDVVGVAAANFLSFGKAIGAVLKAVIAPAVKQMEALGLAIKAAGQAASRDFEGAKESINDAKDAVKDTVGAIADIPDKIGDAFTRLADDQKAAWEVLGESIDNRADAITGNFKEITGAAKKATEEMKKTDTAATVGTASTAGKPAGKTSGRTRTTGKFAAIDQTQNPVENGEARKPDEGIRFQKFVGPGGESFQQRFFNGKKAGRFTDEQLKQAANGQFGTGSMLDQAAARPGAEGLGENKAEEQTAEQTEYLKSIDDRLSKLDGVLSGD